MHVTSIDHVNILTDDLDGTAQFYERLLGLRRGAPPGARPGWRSAWLFDGSDHPMVHLVWNDPESDYGAGHEPGAGTGSLHHVAFRCQGFDAVLDRVKAMDAEYRINDFPGANLKQIFLRDPNNIALELNFATA